MKGIHPLAVTATFGLAASLAVTACDLDVPDLNNPGLGQLQDTPTVASVNAACTGLLIGGRRNVAAENGYVSELGILGREAYNFDSADPRYVTEMIAGTLSRASFGANFWALPYSNIRTANLTLDGLDKVAEFSDADKKTIRGFIHTMQAIDLLEVINTHDTNGAVIDTDQPIVPPPGAQPLGAIVDKPTTLAAIAKLLDDGAGELAAGSSSFTFGLPSGFHNDDPVPTFDTPAGFRTFNRAMRARVAVYMTDYATALTALSESFLDDKSMVIPLELGVFFTFSTKSGDILNGLVNQNIYAHPSVATDAQAGDARVIRKVETAVDAKGNPRPGAELGLSSTLAFKLYPKPNSPVPQIRNEELLLLKAEALYNTGDTDGATAELNLVRQQSGKLPPLAAAPDKPTFINQLLYERRYSLLFEGGHRWIDLRRLDLDLLKKQTDRTTDTVNLRYPIPQAECDARPGEHACTLGSTDP
jgi:hypothetical protein